VGKNKLARWNELGTFTNVIQPPIGEVLVTGAADSTGLLPLGDVAVKDHFIKGNWNRDIFGNHNPIVLELGCGRGEYTVGLAARFPGKNFAGIDIKGARMWRGAKTSNEEKLTNAAFLRTRIEFISSFFSEDEVDEIWITFPDPHPGARNANKRLTSPWYLNSYSRIMKNKGIIHLKTDNTELYKYTSREVTAMGLEVACSTDDLYSGNLSGDILSIRTHYEKIFLATGQKIKYLSFILEREKIREYARQERQ
jgi:tRNA (guanine-N7-)-methyltransferase